MIGLGEFFKKVQNSFVKELSLRASIKEIVMKHTNIEIPIENISYKSGSIILKNVNQTAKSVIFIKKKVILEEIYKQNPGLVVSDIR